MSCERFRPAIAAHAGGAEIDAAGAQHVSACATCRRLLETQRQMLAALDAELGRSLSLTASPGFAARVARAARETGAAPAQRWIPAPVWAGLGVAAAIALAVWVRQPSVDNRSRPSDVQLSAESVGVGSAVKPETAVGPRATLSAAAAVGAGAAVVSGSLDPGRHAPARSRTAPTVAAAGRTPDADPPVIVEAERALAIQRLRELMMQGRLDEKMLPPPVTPEAALAELSIAPLEIAEIRVPDVEIVGRPPAAPQRQ
jgi:hypothetical protein